jgi:hypothetical protein
MHLSLSLSFFAFSQKISDCLSFFSLSLNRLAIPLSRRQVNPQALSFSLSQLLSHSLSGRPFFHRQHLHHEVQSPNSASRISLISVSTVDGTKVRFL